MQIITLSESDNDLQLSRFWRGHVPFLCPEKCVQCPANVNETPGFGHFCLDCGILARGTFVANRGVVNAKKIRKAHLSANEDTTWVRAFEYYKGMGLTDSRADKRAWNDTKFEHPRLRGFDGCYPKVRGK